MCSKKLDVSIPNFWKSYVSDITTEELPDLSLYTKTLSWLSSFYNLYSTVVTCSTWRGTGKEMYVMSYMHTDHKSVIVKGRYRSK